MARNPALPLDAATKQRLRTLHVDSRALLDTFADRLSEQRVSRLRTFSDVGEWGLLVDGLCASLVKRGSSCDAGGA